MKAVKKYAGYPAVHVRTKLIKKSYKVNKKISEEFIKHTYKYKVKKQNLSSFTCTLKSANEGLKIATTHTVRRYTQRSALRTRPLASASRSEMDDFSAKFIFWHRDKSQN